jgi:Siphovirus Gp157
MSTSMTLYGISGELLNLMVAREALLDDTELSPKDLDIALNGVETAIREQVSALVRKVDGAAFYVREFEARALAAKAEKERNQQREHMWKARGERLKEYIVSVMQMLGATRLEGDSNTLSLRKCPPSVEITQPELVPAEYATVTLKIPKLLWGKIGTLIFTGTGDREEIIHQMDEWQSGFKVENPLTPIKEALKRGDGVPGCSLRDDKMSLRVE